MKRRIIAWIVLSVWLVGMAGFRSAAEPQQKIYLTVSEITFSYVGQSESIYIGTVPVDQVSWYSDDPEIVDVVNGILVAEAVGTTTIHAEYEDQHWTCTASCLAENKAKLNKVTSGKLNKPKRMPAKTDYDPVAFYKDAVFVGDSISLIFYQNEQVSNQLGHPLFLTRGGTGINGFLNHFKNLLFMGENVYLEDAIKEAGKKKLFIMLGQNDLGYLEVGETLENYAALLALIREKSPDIDIYIQTLAQEYAADGTINERNSKIYDFNERLPQFAEENNCQLVDVAPYLECHRNSLVPLYSLDEGIHVNYEGCLIWGQVLTNFAQLQEIKGEA